MKTKITAGVAVLLFMVSLLVACSPSGQMSVKNQSSPLTEETGDMHTNEYSLPEETASVIISEPVETKDTNDISAKDKTRSPQWIDLWKLPQDGSYDYLEDVPYYLFKAPLAKDGEVIKRTSLPNVKAENVNARINNLRNSNNYYIAALDLELEIPEGFYLYCINGLYMDVDGDVVELEFVDEYVFTVVERTEEELISDIRSFQHRSQIQPPYIVYSFEVFQKDYLPIETLFTPKCSSTGKCRMCGDYICRMGNSTWHLFYRDFANQKEPCYHPYLDLFLKELMYGRDEWIPEDEFPVFDWERQIIAKTNNGKPDPIIGSKEDYREGESYIPKDRGVYIDYLYNIQHLYKMQPLVGEVSSHIWWETYHQALEEMERNPGYYEMVEIEVDTKPQPDSSEEKWKQLDNSVVRAAAYAYLTASGVSLDLTRVYIFALTTQSGSELIVVVSVDPDDGYQVTPLFAGENFLNCLDLSFAREYARTYLCP